jgi:hypothetical protein
MPHIKLCDGSDLPFTSREGKWSAFTSSSAVWSTQIIFSAFFQHPAHKSFTFSSPVVGRMLGNVTRRCCATCDKSYTTVGSLNRHRQQVHLALLTTICFECKFPNCDRVYKWKHGLVAHHRSAHREVNEDFLFEAASNEDLFEAAHKLTTGWSSSPSAHKRYTCEKCNVHYTSQGSLKRHEKVQHGTPGMRLACPVPHCDRVYKWKHALVEHVKFYHATTNFTPAYPCVHHDCTQTFNHKGDWKRHSCVCSLRESFQY